MVFSQKKQQIISKSRYLSGRQCLKYLWYQFHRKKEIPPFSADTLELFKQGQIVGELAQSLYPGGIKLTRDFSPYRMDQKSREALLEKKTVFEAGLLTDNLYAIADILVPVAGGGWDLIEVKSGTKVKTENLYDGAFQKYTYEKAGLLINRSFIMYVNREYEKIGAVDPEKFFIKEEITDKIKKIIPQIEKELATISQAVSKDKMPEIEIGYHCLYPYACPLKEVCWKFLPAESVFALSRGKKEAFGLLEKKILKLTDIPADYKLNRKQKLQIKAHALKKPHINKKKIESFLEGLSYPLYLIDFETIAPAIPVYDKTHPYEDLPFQYSLHVIEKEGALPVHDTFIAKGDLDPRPEILSQLKEKLGHEGSIVAYNAAYEIKCLEFAVRAYPEYKDWFESIKPRFFDLWVPFSEFYYYHPKQMGRTSLKKVVPALTDLNYHDLEIADGGKARLEYMRVTFDEKIAKSERERVHHALDKYCEMDTLVMLEIIKALKKILGGTQLSFF